MIEYSQSIEARNIKSNAARTVCRRPRRERELRRRGGAASRALGDGNKIPATVAEMRRAIKNKIFIRIFRNIRILDDGYFIGCRHFLLYAAG